MRFPLTDLIREPTPFLFFTGKGGVGKTSLACATAVALADAGKRVLLVSTDPASNLDEVMGTAGRNLDANGCALLEEDLRSPCTEEVAVFRAFARMVAEGKDSFVVLDTAPTGHTLLLLDATEAYHREVARNASNLPEEVCELLPRLRDREFTRILIITLPEPTPVHEAADLQSDLRRAHIEPWAWVINQSFVRCGTADPVLAARGHGEVPFIKEVVAGLSRRTALVPWLKDEPVGPAKLGQLLEPSQH
jgi:arsenite-transporting ATPase